MKRKSPRIELLSAAILALAFCLVSSQPLTADNLADVSPLRVGLVRGWSGARSVSVSAGSAFRIMKTGTSECVAAGAVPLMVVAGERGLLIRRNGTTVEAGASVTVRADGPAATVALNRNGLTKRYRGAIEISPKSGELRLVNVVEPEDYLLGVVPAEISERAPPEALKAQAVAARTYALRNRGKHSASGFDVCDDTHCQVYAGASAEKPNCSKAVAGTSGLVVTYGGELAHVMYSADCGGATENYAELAPGFQASYLGGVTEPTTMPHRRWEKSYSLHELSAILTRAGIKEAAGLQSLTIAKTSSSGRAMSVEVAGAGGTAFLSGERLRSILQLGSKLYKIDTSTPGRVTFRGRGLGHGIGMCQVGAMALARTPTDYTCEQILAHYFPGTTLRATTQIGATLAAAAPHNADVICVSDPSLPAPAVRSAGPRPAQQPSGEVRMKLRLEEPHL